jgi:hypothetical protein
MAQPTIQRLRPPFAQTLANANGLSLFPVTGQVGTGWERCKPLFMRCSHCSQCSQCNLQGRQGTRRTCAPNGLSRTPREPPPSLGPSGRIQVRVIRAAFSDWCMVCLRGLTCHARRHAGADWPDSPYRLDVPPIFDPMPPNMPPDAPGICHTISDFDGRQPKGKSRFSEGKRKRPEEFALFRP